MDQNSRSQTAWPVSKLSTESVGSRRELVANCVHTADATQLDSCVASAMCIGLNAALDAHISNYSSALIDNIKQV